MGFWLHDIPRGGVRDAIIEGSRGLPHHPGPGYTGGCKLVQAPKAVPDAAQRGIPVCVGHCEGTVKCHLVIVAFEGRHSDVYDIAIFCSCVDDAMLDRVLREMKGRKLDPHHLG